MYNEELVTTDKSTYYRIPVIMVVPSEYDSYSVQFHLKIRDDI